MAKKKQSTGRIVLVVLIILAIVFAVLLRVTNLGEWLQGSFPPPYQVKPNLQMQLRGPVTQPVVNKVHDGSAVEMGGGRFSNETEEMGGPRF